MVPWTTSNPERSTNRPPFGVDIHDWDAPSIFYDPVRPIQMLSEDAYKT